MAADVNFEPFIVRAIRKTRKTTDQLYMLAQSRGLKLAKARKRDASRPTQFAWQHQLRRDQHNLSTQGVIRRYADGTWGLA